ncbi:hypothetical protein [uncultured Parabacteroides sp.]|jgi:hypothetical protein|uniref:hypothetical protein n=2 Tax=uncultured Parabacteroides sp. TaxID=512312 RepID=UPI002636D93D|nr:hypothetical protein [uncultured Parabacteroides sp.]
MIDDNTMNKWMKHTRRHEANIFNALFYDQEAVNEEAVHTILSRVASFFDLPIPLLHGQCESMAKIMTSDDANQCELYYNMRMLNDVGINNLDAMHLCLVHEMAHQVLRDYKFRLFHNEKWIQELAADLIVGAYSQIHDIASGKYKYAVSIQKASLTHPDGLLRKSVIDFSRQSYELSSEGRLETIHQSLRTLPYFIFSHFDELRKGWNQVCDELEHPPVVQRTNIEDLPDSNLLKQMVLKYKQQKTAENEDNR